MTSYAKSIDLTENLAHGCKFSAVVGTGGVTAGQIVKWDGATANTVIVCTANTDYAIGIARDTVSEGGSVLVLGNNCLVKTGQTLTVGARVGINNASTGYPVDYAAGTTFGSVVDGTTSASIIRIKTIY